MPDANSSPPEQDSPDEGAAVRKGGAKTPDLGSMTFESLCGELAKNQPTPAAGSGAAAVAALGVSLVSMAFRRSSSEGASPIPAYMGGRADELDTLRTRLQHLMDKDAQVFDDFLGAHKLPSDSDAARAKRRAALKGAAREIVEVPFEIIEVSLAGLRLAAVGAPDQHPNLRCETLGGARALWAAMETCAHIVRENLPVAAVESAELAEQHGQVLPTLMEKGAALLAEIQTATGALIGEPAGPDS